jgi:tripartite-type tricarboxylate transporter receptor subunit TctC
MDFPRRQFLHLAAGAAALPAVSRVASAQTYPTRPVRLIVGFAAGGPADIAARLIGQSLSEQLGRPFVIENRPGAGSNTATEAVVRAAPDGYTLLQVSTTNAYNASLYDNLNFDFVRDVAPVASLYRTASVMEVNPSVPANTVPEFIAYAKANPGRVHMATGGIGSVAQVYGELFKAMTGLNLVPVHYRGSAPALVDLMAGQVQVMFDPIASSIGYIVAGKLRPLAVTTATRSATLPDIPTVGDFVPGYEASGWQGICAPKNTPAEIIERLNKATNAALLDPKMKARVADLGGVPLPMTPGEFGRLIAEETEKWAKIIRAAMSLILDTMRPGDILTHAYTGVPNVAGEFTNIVQDGHLIPAALAAKRRGVLFDVGHGGASFDYTVAEAAIAQGCSPNTISSDIHVVSGNTPGMPYLVWVMSKFMGLGFTLEEVVAMTTINPAKVINRSPKLGTLQAGAPGDVAIMELVEGPVSFVDTRNNARTGRAYLKPVQTVTAGVPFGRPYSSPFSVR